jgi:hypothetical protein
MDKLFYVKEKATADEVAYFAKSGWTLATNVLTASAIPATGKRIEVFYAKASA